jgi:uncharacterized cupredoxin-like copper-binding protein
MPEPRQRPAEARRTRRNVGLMGLLLLLTLILVEPDLGHAAARKPARTVSVTAGKPSEFKFTLSARTVRTGVVTFTIRNRGTIAHDFKVCTAPTKKASATTCKGRGTRRISPGKSAKLSIRFRKKGTYEYLCTVPGHAAAGMKGLVTVR